MFPGGDQKGTLGRKGLRYEKLQEKFSRNSSSRKGNPWVLWVYDLYEKLIMLVPKSHSLTTACLRVKPFHSGFVSFLGSNVLGKNKKSSLLIV